MTCEKCKRDLGDSDKEPMVFGKARPDCMYGTFCKPCWNELRGIMTDPIISETLPPAIEEAAKEVEPCEAMNYGEDILPQFQAGQRAAILRFCAAVEEQAQEMYDSDKRRNYDQEFRLAFFKEKSLL